MPGWLEAIRNRIANVRARARRALAEAAIEGQIQAVERNLDRDVPQIVIGFREAHLEQTSTSKEALLSDLTDVLGEAGYTVSAAPESYQDEAGVWRVIARNAQKMAELSRQFEEQVREHLAGGLDRYTLLFSKADFEAGPVDEEVLFAKVRSMAQEAGYGVEETEEGENWRFELRKVGSD
jgi:AcrR family transcriptional regulator